MLLPRATIARSVRQLRNSRLSPSGASSGQWRQQAGRKGYATGHDAKQAASSMFSAGELPWLIGAVAVTVPGTYWILANGTTETNAGLPGSKWHGEGHHDDDEEHEDGEEEEGGEEEGESEKDTEEKGDEEDSADAKEADKADDKAEGDEKDGGDEEQSEDNDDGGSKTVKKEDAKGGIKRRIESPAGKKLGEGEGESSAGTDPEQDEMHGKQAGLSNTDTKHPTDPGNDPEKSKKGSGVPETAKVQGTVDPNRPQK